ncbi:MAG: hypothetical protein C5B58_11480 [Acidobacteria bacterium]|nr:MAG: hypothetical protein C5B58_11480 [Acidobacteriota bacterium]
MTRRLRLLALAMLISSQDAGFTAVDVEQRDSEPPKISEEQARSLAIYAPRPEYPYEARAKWLTGDGLVRLDVDPRTGFDLELKACAPPQF